MAGSFRVGVRLFWWKFFGGAGSDYLGGRVRGKGETIQVEVLRGIETCMWICQAGSPSPCVSYVLRPYICSPLGGAGFDPSGELYTVYNEF